jgi:hypothetical protein
MTKLVAGIAGLVTAALLFPTGGVTGCPGGGYDADCVSYSKSVLVRYPGENGAIGMGVAIAAGLAVVLLVYFVAERLISRSQR